MLHQMPAKAPPKPCPRPRPMLLRPMLHPQLQVPMVDVKGKKCIIWGNCPVWQNGTLVSVADGPSTKTGKRFKKVQQNLLHLGAIEVAFENLFDTCHCAKQRKMWIPCGRARDAVWGRDPAMRKREIATAIAKFFSLQKNFQMNIFCGVAAFEQLEGLGRYTREDRYWGELAPGIYILPHLCGRYTLKPWNMMFPGLEF